MTAAYSYLYQLPRICGAHNYGCHLVIHLHPCYIPTLPAQTRQRRRSDFFHFLRQSPRVLRVGVAHTRRRVRTNRTDQHTCIGTLCRIRRSLVPAAALRPQKIASRTPLSGPLSYQLSAPSGSIAFAAQQQAPRCWTLAIVQPEAPAPPPTRLPASPAELDRPVSRPTHVHPHQISDMAAAAGGAGSDEAAASGGAAGGAAFSGTRLPNILIAGTPGTGKTTLSASMAVRKRGGPLVAPRRPPSATRTTVDVRRRSWGSSTSTLATWFVAPARAASESRCSSAHKRPTHPMPPHTAQIKTEGFHGSYDPEFDTYSLDDDSIEKVLRVCWCGLGVSYVLYVRVTIPTAATRRHTRCSCWTSWSRLLQRAARWLTFTR